jgi:hypothetical protein
MVACGQPVTQFACSMMFPPSPANCPAPTTTMVPLPCR